MRFAGRYTDGEIVLAGHVRDVYCACGHGEIQRIGGGVLCADVARGRLDAGRAGNGGAEDDVPCAGGDLCALKRERLRQLDGSGASGDGQGAVLRFREIDRDFRRVEIEADLGIPAAGIGGLDQQVSASTATVCFAFSAS